MDPGTGIQLAASAAELIELAFKVFMNLYKYYRNVKDAPARSIELRLELDGLLDLLTSAQQIFERNRDSYFRTSLPQQLSDLRNLLNQLYSKTNPQDVAGYRRLRWPFQDHENAEIISKLEKHKTKLLIGVNIDQT